jgi:hypothetical protein
MTDNAEYRYGHENVSLVGELEHSDAISFLAEHGAKDVNEPLYLASLPTSGTGRVSDDELGSRLARDAVLAELAQLERPTTADAYVDAFDAAVRRTNIDRRRN